MVRRVVVAWALAATFVPLLPAQLAAACSGPLPDSLETFEAVTIANDALLWTFQLDDGTTRDVFIYAKDDKQGATTSCDSASRAPGLGGRYLVTVAKSERGLAISALGGSITELVPSPTASTLPPLARPSGRSYLVSAAAGVLGAVGVLVASAVVRRRRARADRKASP